MCHVFCVASCELFVLCSHFCARALCVVRSMFSLLCCLLSIAYLGLCYNCVFCMCVRVDVVVCLKMCSCV